MARRSRAAPIEYAAVEQGIVHEELVDFSGGDAVEGVQLSTVGSEAGDDLAAAVQRQAGHANAIRPVRVVGEEVGEDGAGGVVEGGDVRAAAGARADDEVDVAVAVQVAGGQENVAG